MGVWEANMEAGLGGRKRENILLEQDIRRDVTNHKGTSISIRPRSGLLRRIV